MTDLRAAAQQALEALEGGADSWRLIGPAIDALRKALEQPEQEPVAWWIVSKTIDEEFVSVRPNDWSDINWEKHPLYTHPPRREWRGLTEEEIRHFAWNGFLMAEGTWDKDTEEDLLTFARAIEQACKERNP